MTEEITQEEYWRLQKRRETKYRNRAGVEEGGYTFDSLAEAEHYRALALLQQAGVIEGLKVHPCYELLPAFQTRAGVRIKAIIYEADFCYTLPGQTLEIVEDVKGHRTKEFRLKEKLFRYRYPQIDLRILEVRS